VGFFIPGRNPSLLEVSEGDGKTRFAPAKCWVSICRSGPSLVAFDAGESNPFGTTECPVMSMFTGLFIFVYNIIYENENLYISNYLIIK
jgi:hypothetical protein